MRNKFFSQLYSESRDQTADLLKGFAVLMMIQIHLTELFAVSEISQSHAGKISLFLGGPPAAPLFMGVMGYFLAQSKKSLIQNFKRGLVLILGGILLNIGLNLHLLLLIFNGEVHLDPLKYIFGADILPLAGLSVIVISVLNKLSHKNFYAGSILTILITITILIVHNLTINYVINDKILIYLQAFLFGGLDWSYFPFFPWAVYPLGGYLYKIVSQRYKPESAVIETLVLIFAVISFVTISYAIGIASDLKLYYHHDWKYSLWIFQFLILLIFIFKCIQEYFGKSPMLIYIKWLGKNVTAVYVIQWLLIGNIATSIFQSQNELMLVTWFVSILFLTTLLVYFFEKWSERHLKEG